MRRILLVVVLACGCDNNNSGTDPDAPPCTTDCEDAGVEPDAPIAPIGAYVSVMIGDDSNMGTVDSPLATISKGIANAMMLGGDRTVIVAQGVYNEKVALVEGIDLLGGHQCNTTTCDWARDITAYKSQILNTDFEGVVANTGITHATLLSGFTITGLPGTPTSTAGTVALTLSGGSPTIRGNTIAGADTLANTGPEPNNRSIGVAVRGTSDAAGVLIENNEITSGAAVQSVGVAIESTSPAVTSLVNISSNVIRSGTARRSIGVYALRAVAGSKLVNNDVTAGSSAGGPNTGIQVNSPITVERNRVNLDRATAGTCTQTGSWCAGIFVEGATTTITNNVVMGPRGQRTTGLLLAELEIPAGTVTVANNYFDGGGSGPNGVSGSRNTSSAIVLLISNNMQVTLTGTVGRLGNNILSGGNNADRFGIREDAPSGRTIHPVFVNNNFFTFSDVFGRDDAVYREIGDSGIPFDYSSVFFFEEASGLPAMKNGEGDPLLDSSWHVDDKSPCIDAGTATDAPATDFDGDARPAGLGVDVGHDEN
ncbi:MAG: choice-of-anchor Q domain-containing protein [Kofleriaceae bacterium]